MQRVATHCNTLQHTETHCIALKRWCAFGFSLTAAHCNTLQHLQHRCAFGFLLTASHCNALEYTATHCNTLQHIASFGFSRTATHCNALQNTATQVRAVGFSLSTTSRVSAFLCARCDVLQCIAVCGSMLHCVAMCGCVLQCVVAHCIANGTRLFLCASSSLCV